MRIRQFSSILIVLILLVLVLGLIHQKMALNEIHQRCESIFYELYRTKHELEPFKEILKSNEKINYQPSNSKSDVLNHIPSIWPTEGRVTSLFGMRKHPITGRQKFHKGVDIGNRQLTDIICAAHGIVDHAGWKGGYGKTVIVNHGMGYKTLYAHADELLVQKGDKVQRGTLIARMGSTGSSTGPHLHYEVHLAKEPIDPVLLIQ